MGKLSKIEWTHHTFNPWMGCVEVSPACDHCYARTLVTGRMALPVWGKGAERRETSLSYWHQPFAWDRAAERAGERHRVFCGSLCDVMEEGGPNLNRIRGDLWKVIESTPNLDWLLLTKRPQNFRKFLPAHWIETPRPNVWGMTTVESAEYLWRVNELLKTPFVVRGLSVEPLLGTVDLAAIPCADRPEITRNNHQKRVDRGVSQRPLRASRPKRNSDTHALDRSTNPLGDCRRGVRRRFASDGSLLGAIAARSMRGGRRAILLQAVGRLVRLGQPPGRYSPRG